VARIGLRSSYGTFLVLVWLGSAYQRLVLRPYQQEERGISAAACLVVACSDARGMVRDGRVIVGGEGEVGRGDLKRRLRHH